MKEKTYKKLFFIYTYIRLGENNLKMYYEICKRDSIREWQFELHNKEENEFFISKWKKDNNIKLSEWWVAGIDSKNCKMDKNGNPIFVERKN